MSGRIWLIREVCYSPYAADIIRAIWGACHRCDFLLVSMENGLMGKDQPSQRRKRRGV